MEKRLAILGIIVQNTDSAEQINSILHEYAEFIIGRMGIPYKDRKISFISVAIDAPQDAISALSGKIGKLNGVSCKTAYSDIKQ